MLTLIVLITKFGIIAHFFHSGSPSMNTMNPRMNHPRGPGMAPMGPGSYGPGMRGPPPNSNLPPGGPGGPGMPPMSMSGPGGRPGQWQPNTSTVSQSLDLHSIINLI